jgi:mannosyltransferase
VATVDTPGAELAAAEAPGTKDSLAARGAPLVGLAAAILSLALGALLLERRPLSVLEAATAERAGTPFRPLLDWALENDPGLAGFTALLHPVVSVSTQEWALRGPSVVAAALACIGTYGLGTILAGRLAGAVAAVALALDAGVVAVSQQARPLALSLLAIVVSTLVLALALTRSDRWWLAYVPACLLLAVSHPAAVSVLAAQAGAIAVVCLRTARSWTRAAAAFLLAAAAAVPLAVAALADRVASAGSGTLDAGELGRGLARAAGWSPALVLLAVFGGVALATGLAPKAAAWKAVLVAGLVVAPVAALALAAVWLPVHTGWTAILAAPGLALGAGAGVAALPGRAAVVAACAVLVASALPGLAAWYQADPENDWRAATGRVATRLPDAARLVVLPDRATSVVRYYRPDLELAARARGREAWILVEAATPRQAIEAARAVVQTPRFALLEQRRVGDDLLLQRWVRP